MREEGDVDASKFKDDEFFIKVVWSSSQSEDLDPKKD